MVVVEYSSNNSGGRWWLSDDDWHALEAAGWDVRWVRDDQGDLRTGDRWLGALATEATKEFDDPRDAIAEFQRITGQDASAEGCNCCGPPHSFSYVDETGAVHYATATVVATAIEFD